MSSTELGAFNFDDLPDVDLTDLEVSPGARVPRFAGDVSELPNQACWVLQNLLTRRYLSKNAQPELWAWLIEHRKAIASRLAELDLRLRVHDDLEVAYAEPAVLDNPSPHGSKVLRREPLGTYASIVALHLAKIARTAHDEHVISRDAIHDLFSNVRHSVDRDEAMLRGRIDEAITRLIKAEILLRTRDDEDSYTISPVILAIMTGQMVDALNREFEQLRRAAADLAEDEPRPPNPDTDESETDTDQGPERDDDE
jgi:hypothetical protein